MIYFNFVDFVPLVTGSVLYARHVQCFKLPQEPIPKVLEQVLRVYFYKRNPTKGLLHWFDDVEIILTLYVLVVVNFTFLCVNVCVFIRVLNMTNIIFLL